MDQKAKARVRRECKELLKPFGIPLDDYNAGEIIPHGSGVVFDVAFRHKRTAAEIIVTNVWPHSETAEVLQSGSHYGALEF